MFLFNFKLVTILFQLPIEWMLNYRLLIYGLIEVHYYKTFMDHPKVD